MSKANRMAYMVNHRLVLLDSSKVNHWQCLVHSKVFNEASNCEMLLMFGNKTLQKITLDHLYTSTYIPLRDKKFLKELNTTTSHMFSHVAVAAEYMIDKIVEEACGRTVQFLVELALSLPLHKETLPAQFANLHQRGLHVLRGKSGLLSPEKLIYMPETMDQLLRPHQAGTSGNGSGLHLQSSPAIAMLQVLTAIAPNTTSQSTKMLTTCRGPMDSDIQLEEESGIRGHLQLEDYRCTTAVHQTSQTGDSSWLAC
ncbi:hypothetical protein EDB19DRAFT_1836919 [Suillus lakei]|nr:hypothetical protein EDB19DRAFT_1836919 [Suillus lakei]